VVTAPGGARSGPRTPQGSTGAGDVVRGWVGLAQLTITVGTLGRIPVFGGFMSAGCLSRVWRCVAIRPD
jgi:hypothetical protein